MSGLAARVAAKLEARAATVALRARALRILIVTDAWAPQINGVVTTLRNTIRELEALGHTVGTITPESFRTLPCPTYPDIRLAVLPGRRVARPDQREGFPGQRPIFVYVGRVAVEKNIEAFLALDLPGTKWVVGDGPARADLERRFPFAKFVGMKSGAELAWHYRQADVFVFPSRTDTFGLVLIDAMACGTPVAAYPVVGPIDVVKDPRAGILHQDLAVAAMAALQLDRSFVRRYGEGFAWDVATAQCVANLHPVNTLQTVPAAPQPVR